MILLSVLKIVFSFKNMNSTSKQTTHSIILYFLHILISLQIFFGAIILIICESIKYSLLNYLHAIQQNQLTIILFIVEMFGLHLIIFHICGIPLAKKCARESFTEHLSLLIKFWNAVVLVTSIEGIISSVVCSKSMHYVHESIESSLYMGLDAYLSDTSWRLLWDYLQINLQCCGIRSYKDWIAVSWTECESSNQKKEYVMI